jgi:hypothetical protein
MEWRKSGIFITVFEYNDSGYLIQDRVIYKDSTIWSSDSIEVYEWDIYNKNNYYYYANNCTTIVFLLWNVLNQLD